jgi:hypothetical protein
MVGVVVVGVDRVAAVVEEEERRWWRWQCRW